MTTIMTTMMNEKSKWFYSYFKADTTAVVLIAPGLNLRPSKMDQLASFFTSKKCDVFRISLGDNPEDWSSNFSDAYDEAYRHAEIIERPLYFLGFSLGALIGVHYIVRHSHHQFQKCVLMAPATHTRPYTIIPALLASLFKKGSLPSFNLKDYRERSKTTLAEYQKMRCLQNEIKKNNLLNNVLNIPILFVTNPQDELIASSKLLKVSAKNSKWTSLELTNKGSLLPKKYHHLMIDSDSLGLKEWEKLLQHLAGHFAV